VVNKKLRAFNFVEIAPTRSSQVNTTLLRISVKAPATSVVSYVRISIHQRLVDTSGFDTESLLNFRGLSDGSLLVHTDPNGRKLQPPTGKGTRFAVVFPLPREIAEDFVDVKCVRVEAIPGKIAFQIEEQ
jgi:hypothetical protein